MKNNPRNAGAPSGTPAPPPAQDGKIRNKRQMATPVSPAEPPPTTPLSGPLAGPLDAPPQTPPLAEPPRTTPLAEPLAEPPRMTPLAEPLAELSPTTPFAAPLPASPLLDDHRLTAHILAGLERDPGFDLGILAEELNAQYPIEDPADQALAELILERLQRPVWEAGVVLRLQPQHRRAILDALAAAIAAPAVPAAPAAPATIGSFSDRMEAILQEAQGRHDAAAQTVRRHGPDDLARLPLTAKRDLLRDLVGGQVRDPGEADLALLYAAIDLEPGFAAADAEMRREARELLRDRLRHEVRQWARIDDGVRLDLLNRALSLHGSALGMTGAPPALVLVPKADEQTGSCGNYDFVTGAILLNPRSSLWNDIDEVFNTVIHENTHHYQMWLAAQLTPEQVMTSEDQRHLQAALFALNKRGYLQPSAGLGGYMSQPVERHAFLAGDEVMGLWLKDAREEGAAMLATLLATPHEAAPLYAARLAEVLESTSVSGIFASIDRARDFLARLPGGQAVKQLQDLEHHPGGNVILDARRRQLLEEAAEPRDPGALTAAIARLRSEYDDRRPGPPTK
ncbi:hypothetical protein GCM10022419_091540 [Nonomuraea rosea]|uniref:Uncharacterized protein n=1 Tax=Nonomuraea rosea TaxID=638574 RepID=A0ABP6YZ10_9ACTN